MVKGEPLTKLAHASETVRQLLQAVHSGLAMLAAESHTPSEQRGAHRSNSGSDELNRSLHSSTFPYAEPGQVPP